MIEYEHKLQGDGRDSWKVTEWETNKKEVMLSCYMVYEDPTKEQKVDISKTDVDTIDPKELTKLAQKIKKELGL